MARNLCKIEINEDLITLSDFIIGLDGFTFLVSNVYKNGGANTTTIIIVKFGIWGRIFINLE